MVSQMVEQGQELKPWLASMGVTFLERQIIIVGREESEHYLLPKVCKVRWTLKNERSENLDFKVFSIPMILAIEDIGHQIRNTSYEFTISGNIFPDKLFRYDEFTLREPLNNAIAHQDYDKGARIEVIEYENDHLVEQLAKLREVNTRLIKRNQDLAEKVAKMQNHLKTVSSQSGESHYFG